MFMESGHLGTKGLIYNGYLAYMLFSYIYINGYLVRYIFLKSKQKLPRKQFDSSDFFQKREASFTFLVLILII